MPNVVRGEAIPNRLADLGLTQEIIEKTVLRADAEARLTSDLEPTTAEGVTRYNKSVGFFREETLPLGWSIDNSKNFCRTMSPARDFAVVISSGDELAGNWIPGMLPSTKYTKGEATVSAVVKNAQLAFDLGDSFAEMPDDESIEAVWILLHRVDEDKIYLELSLPDAVEGGRIVGWSERIIFEPINRAPLSTTEGENDVNETYDVDVAMR